MLRQFEGFESRDGKKVKYDEIGQNIQPLGLTGLMKFFKQDARMWGMCRHVEAEALPVPLPLRIKILGLHDASTSIGPLHVHMT